MNTFFAWKRPRWWSGNNFLFYQVMDRCIRKWLPTELLEIFLQKLRSLSGSEVQNSTYAFELTPSPSQYAPVRFLASPHPLPKSVRTLWISPSSDFRKKLPKFEVFGKLFKFESLNFSDFAYFNRQTWYLTANGGPVAERIFSTKFGPCLDLSPNYFCLQIHFLDCYSSEFIHFAYNDSYNNAI